MRINRLVAGTVSAGLLGLVPLAVSAPAQAADVASTATLESSASGAVTFGDTFFLRGEVDGVDGSSPSTGTVSLQVSTPSNPTWTTVDSSTTPGYYSFSVKAKSNAAYKVVFGGGTSYSNNYLPSESAPLAIKTMRKVDISDKSGYRVTVKVKVKPDFKRKAFKVYTKRKKSASFKLWKKFKTDSRGVKTFKFPRVRGKLYVMFKFPGGKNFTSSVLGQDGSLYIS